MKNNTSIESVIQNLKDAGCDEEMIKKIVGCIEEGKENEKLKLLSRQRCTLLDKTHEEQKKLDCLDYLIYMMKNTKEKNDKKNNEE